MANTIKVSVLGEVRDINNKLGQVNSQLGKTGKVASVAGKLIGAAFAGGAVIAGVKSVVSAASDAQQSLGATQTVFGKYSQSVIQDSKKAAQQFGLDASTYRENANLLGAIFSNQGVAAKKLSGATKEMVGVGADLSATFGGTTTDAVGALSAAFKGEFDSLDKYGISLNATKIAAELAARGQDKLTGAALDAAKQQVTADLIMQQSSKTRGAFAKESNTLAGQQQRLSAQFTNMKATIGSALLPALTSIVSALNSGVLPKMKEWYGVFKSQVVPVIKEVGDWIKSNLLPPLQTLGTFLANNKTVVATFAGVILTIVAAVKVWTAVQTAFNVVMAANPLAIAVIAIAALAAAMVYAYKKSETFRNIVDGAFKGIRAVVSAVMPTIKNIITNVWNGIKNVIEGSLQVIKGVIKVVTSAIKGDWTGVWNGIKQILSGAWQAIKGIVSAGTAVLRGVLSAAWNTAKTLTSNAWDAMKTAVSNGINAVVNFFQSLPGKIRGALGNAATMLTTIGQNIIQGLVNGLESARQWVIDKIQAITDSIPGWVKKRLGIASPSRVMAALGKWISYGLGKGITDGAPAIAEAMKGVTETINEYYDKKIKNDAKAAAASKAAIKGLTDEADALKKNADRRKANRESYLGAVEAVNALIRARNEENRTTKTVTERLDENLTALNAAKEGLRSLIEQRNKENGSVKTNSDLLDENASKLDAARSALDSLKNAAADYIKTVAGGFASFGNLTNLMPDDMVPSSGTIVANLENKVQQAQEFSALIQQLAAQGLNQSNLDQLIQSGVEAGTATARALVDGGPAAISQVNSLTAQLEAAGTQMGTAMSARFHTAGIDAAAATVNALASQREALYNAGIAAGQAAINAIAAQRAALYDSGIQAGQGLVDGFEAMGDKLERAGDRLAKKMVKAIKKALDINSPSRVFRKIGEQTNEGLVIGLKDTAGVERATVNIGKAMKTSFKQPDLHANASVSGRGGSGNTYEIHIKADPLTDTNALGKKLVAVINEAERNGVRRTT